MQTLPTHGRARESAYIQCYGIYFLWTVAGQTDRQTASAFGSSICANNERIAPKNAVNVFKTAFRGKNFILLFVSVLPKKMTALFSFYLSRSPLFLSSQSRHLNLYR